MIEETRTYRIDRAKIMIRILIFTALWGVSIFLGLDGFYSFFLLCAALWSIWKTIFPSQMLVLSPVGIWLPSVLIRWRDINSVELDHGELIVSRRDSTTGGLIPGWDKKVSLIRLSDSPEAVFAEVQQFRSRYSDTP